MAGTMLENLSAKKLSVFVSCLLVLQVVCFLLGGLIAPIPTAANDHLASKCVDKSFNLQGWMRPWGAKECQKVRDFDEVKEKGIQADWIVFTIQMPNRPFQMTPWFKYFIGILIPDIVYDFERPMGTNPKVTLAIKLGYLDDDGPADNVTEIFSVNVTRKWECMFQHAFIKESSGYMYDCDPIPLFKLGSVHHEHYLLNIRILQVADETNEEINSDIELIRDMHLVEIHQNGGFTKVWISLKTALFPLVLITMVWFWRRVKIQDRPPHLLERTTLALAVVVSILNFPLEWVSIFTPAPGMTLVNDLRQEALYATIYSFWTICFGEHLKDQSERNSLKAYWRQITAITFTCFCLCIIDVCQRVVQTSNVFEYGSGIRLDVAYIILATTGGTLYFFYLCFMAYKVLKKISMHAVPPDITKDRKINYDEGLIHRLTFFIFATLLCAIMTILFCILSQVNEAQWKWGVDDPTRTIQYTGAFFTGVYGMWNMYVLAVLVLYAPSHESRRNHGYDVVS